MVIKTDLCSFSEWRIYPGHGRRFVAKDAEPFLLEKLKAKKSNGQLLGEDQTRKLKLMKGQKKRRIRNLKVQRAIVGISQEEIRRRRKEDEKTRKAQAEQAARKLRIENKNKLMPKKHKKKGQQVHKKLHKKLKLKQLKRQLLKLQVNKKEKMIDICTLIIQYQLSKVKQFLNQFYSNIQKLQICIDKIPDIKKNKTILFLITKAFIIFEHYFEQLSLQLDFQMFNIPVLIVI